MEDTYQNELEKVRKEKTELKQQIKFMRVALSSVISDIIELTATDEDECPCSGDCGCKGDDNEDNFS